jgi:cytochrome P450
MEPDFIPPYPPRPARALSPLAVLATARRNLLEIWEEAAFGYELMSIQVLTRRIWVCNSPDTVRHALIEAGTAFETKSPQMRTALKPLLGDGLFISDGATWAARRPAVTPIVHISRMGRFAPDMVAAAEETAEQWAGAAEIEALGDMARLAAEIICRSLFGARLGRERASAIVEAFSEYQRHIGQVDLPAMLGLPGWLPRLRGRRIRAAAARIRGIFEAMLDAHEADPAAAESSVMGALLSADLSREAVRNEVATLFMAGHETTANTLAWAWYLISQCPRVEARLHAELDAVLGGRSPALEDIPALPYTRAVIDETLRLYPPVPLLAREATAAETLRGRRVAPGSLIVVAPWLLHRHRQHWDAPDAFRPERFLEPAPPSRRYVYLPFSLGARVCAGMAFGLTESVLCLATLAQHYRLALKPGAEVRAVSRLTLRPSPGLPMVVTPRAPAAQRGAA